MSYMAMKEQMQTPENERRIPAQKPISDTITISVAEYHCLTKAATLLEMIFNCDSYHRDGLVTAARKTIQDMQRAAETGAEK